MGKVFMQWKIKSGEIKLCLMDFHYFCPLNKALASHEGRPCFDVEVELTIKKGG